MKAWLNRIQLVAVLFLWPANLIAAEALSIHQDWSVFVETTPKPKTCWVATKSSREGNILLGVTRFRGRKTPQVSVFSTQRLKRSAGMVLVVDGTEYRMKSDGRNAWPKGDYVKLVNELRKLEKSAQPYISLKIKKVEAGRFSLNGLNRALDIAVKECQRP